MDRETRESRTELTLKPYTQAVSALHNGHAVPIYEHCRSFRGSVWLVMDEWGVSALVMADSLESAWEEWLDNQPAIPASEEPEAYGFEGPTADADFQAAVAAAQDGAGPWPELVEGYRQANHGVVWEGFYLHFRELTVADARMFGLQVRSFDHMDD